MNTNHETSAEYERLVEQFVRQGMEGISGVDGLEILRDVRMKGSSGHEHQIDVCYRFRVWNTEFLVLVECKQYRKKVGIEDLLTFRSRMDDRRAHKGVFVTATGYQRGALEYAKAHRISLLIVRGDRMNGVSFSFVTFSCSTKRVSSDEELENARLQRAAEKIHRLQGERERCQKQAKELIATMGSIRSNVIERFAITQDVKFVSISGGGACILIKPGELTSDQSVDQLTDFKGPLGEIFLEGHPLGTLKAGALLKLQLAEILVQLPIGADQDEDLPSSWGARLRRWWRGG